MKTLILILASLALASPVYAANVRTATPVIEDSSQNGDVLSKSATGDSATGKKGLVGFGFRDSSGNLILPQLNASGYFNTFVNNFPATYPVTQSTSPWVVSGTVTANQGSPPWSVSQSGTWTVQQGTPPWSVSQSGTWTTGRTWTLGSGTDSVTSVQGTSPWVTNISQFGGSNVVTGTGASGAGIPRVTVSNDSNVLATQSGAWSVTANAGTNLNTSALALDTTVSGLQVSQGSTTSGQKGGLSLGAVTTAAPTYTTGQTSPFSLTTAGGLRTDSSGSVQPVSQSGTWTVQQGTPPWSVSQSGAWTTGRTWTLGSGTDSVTSVQGTSPWVTNVSQFGGTNVSTGTGTGGAGIPRVTVSNDSNVLATQSGSWSVTANAGTNLNTSALQLDTTGAKLNLSQGSTTSGQTGPLLQGAVTTSAPSYTTAQTSPLSLNTSGGLRVDGSGVTQPVSGTVNAAQSGTWTVQQGTPPWSVGGNVASGATDSGNPVKVGAVFNTTQPTVTNGQRVDIQATNRGEVLVSPGTSGFTVTANAGTNLNTSALATSANLTAGTAKFQQVDGSGNVQPSGDVLTRKIFVQPTDGTNNQGYTAASEAKVSVTQPLPTGTNVIGALTANQSVNVAQVNGVTTSTGTGASGTGTQRVTLAADGAKTSANSTAVVLATDQAGINTFQDKTASGALTGVNQAVTVATNGATTVNAQLLGTFVETVQFEGSIDAGTTYFATPCIYLTINLIPISQLNSTGQVTCYVAGYTNFRVRTSAFTSGTANVVVNTSAGMSANAATQIVRLASSMGEYISSSPITGTAANKQPLDTNNLSTGTGRYSTVFTLQQTAATAINSSVFAMRNAAAATKSAIVESVNCRMGFNPTNPVTRTQQSYVVQRFSAATPTGGTALTAAQGDSADAASQVTDIRFLDTGLTTTGVTFVANNLAAMACDTSQGSTCDEHIVMAPTAIKLLPGEGLVIRLGVAAVTGTAIQCNIAWREQ